MRRPGQHADLQLHQPLRCILRQAQDEDFQSTCIFQTGSKINSVTFDGLRVGVFTQKQKIMNDFN
jgi:hypothetical protein